jgi:hypothetical protein
MAGAQGRKHRTGVSDHVMLAGRVAPKHRKAAERAATALGVSLSTYLDELLARELAAQLDEDGRPVRCRPEWWTGPVPTDQTQLPLSAGETPLKSA